MQAHYITNLLPRFIQNWLRRNSSTNGDKTEEESQSEKKRTKKIEYIDEENLE